MDTPSSSSELHQLRTKDKMPLAASSFTGIAALDPDPTWPSFDAQSYIFPGKSSEFQFSPRLSRSDIPGPFAYHSETPSQAGKANADSGMGCMASLSFNGTLSDSGTEPSMVWSSSDMASISWKEYLPETTEEVSRVNLGEQFEKNNVQTESKDYMFTFGTNSEVEKPDDINLNDQFKGVYGMPRTDSAQSFGSIFNFQEYIPEKNQEGSKLGEPSEVVDVQNQSKENLFTSGTVSKGEKNEGLSFSDYFNDKDQFGGSHAMPQKDSVHDLGAQSFGSSLNFQEFIREVTEESSQVKMREQAGKVEIQNQSKNSLFSLSTDMGGEKADSLSFENYINLKDQFSYSCETPAASSMQSYNTKYPGSSSSFGEYLPEMTQELNADKLGEQFEKLNVQNMGSDGLSFGTGNGGEKTENLFFKDYITLRDESDEAIGMPPTNSIENLGTQSLREQLERADIEKKNKEDLFLKDNTNFGDRFNEFYEMPLKNSTQSLGTESILSTYKFDDYFPETKKSSVKDELFTFNSVSESEGTRFTRFEKEKDFSSTISTGSSFSSPIGGFSLKSKHGNSESPKMEMKSPRRRYIKIHKKGEHKTRAKKIGAKFFSEREFRNEDFVSKSERKFGDYEPMYTPYNDLSQGSSSQGYGKPSEERRFSFGESSNLRGDASYSNPSSETKISFSEATHLDQNLFARNKETTPLYSSFTGTRKTDEPGFFSGSKNSEGISVPISESYNGKKNMSKIGHSSFTARSAPMQFESPEFLKSSSFPSKSSDRLKNEEVNEFPDFGKYGTTRSTAGIQNDGEKWHARGNERFGKGDMKSAEELYTRGIKSLSIGETYQNRNRSLVLCYINRAAARMSLGQIKEAFSDCLAALKIDPNFPKVQLQIANCLLALGNLEEAIKQFNKCLESNSYSNSDPVILSEASTGLHKAHKVLEYISLAEELMKWNSDQVSKALDLISDALSICSNSDRLMEMKAKALMKLRRYEDAIRYCEQTPDSDGKDYISKQWRLNIIAKSYFYLGKLEEALEVIIRNEQAAIDSERYESDSSSSQTEKEIELYEEKSPETDSSFLVTLRELVCLKATGNEAFHAGRYAEAVEHYSAAFSCSTESRLFTAVCLCNRAAAYQALGQIVDAIADCSLAIAFDPTYTKAISRRAVLYDMIRDYDQAANDLRMLISLLEKRQQENQAVKSSKTNISDDLNRARRRLLSAEESANKRIHLNLYLILGVEESASVDDVKKAYKKAALRHHPDKAIQSLAKNETADGDAIWVEVTGRVHNDADHLFKIIGEAYAVLSDTTKRAKYDRDEEKRQVKKTHSAVGTPRKSPSGR